MMEKWRKTALWILGGAVGAVTATSAVFQILGITAKDLFPARPKAPDAAIEAPIEPAPLAPRPAPLVDTATASLPAAPAMIDDLRAVITPGDSAGVMKLAFAIRVAAGRGGSVKFDARRFYLVGFDQGGRACQLTAPIASAWSPKEQATVSGDDLLLNRALLMRVEGERAALNRLAGELGVSISQSKICDGASVRFTRVGAPDLVRRFVRCGDEPFTAFADAGWDKLARESDPTTASGPVIRGAALVGPNEGIAKLRAALDAGVICKSGPGGAAAPALASGLSWLDG
jgi:hypothetical protein